MDFSLLFPLVFAVILLLILIHLFLKKKRQKEQYPYHAVPILTRREYAFYRILKKEADARHLLICPKVGLKDLMEVKDKHNFLQYFRKISQKHVDFVICDKNLNVLFAIELDDRSHDTEDARKRDRFKDRAFKAAGIPLKRIRQFDKTNVRKLFL